MNTARIQAKLDAIIADATALKEEIALAANDAEPDPVFMTIDSYAKRAEVSIETVRKWIRLGLPVRRQGSVVRVRVAEADRWSADAEASRRGERDAHRGRR